MPLYLTYTVQVESVLQLQTCVVLMLWLPEGNEKFLGKKLN